MMQKTWNCIFYAVRNGNEYVDGYCNLTEEQITETLDELKEAGYDNVKVSRYSDKNMAEYYRNLNFAAWTARPFKRR